MIHAKTAVADGRWARVGSTNLNVASWLGNRELDVVLVETRASAARWRSSTERDLQGATEDRAEPAPTSAPRGRGREAAHAARRRQRGAGRGRRAAARANAVGAALVAAQAHGHADAARA
jgi:cardiolipin synthase